MKTHTVPDWLDRTEYPFENRWIELAAGRSLHYVDEGQGETLLFVHGTPTWSFEWRHLIRQFSDQYQCVAPDLIGMGLSSRPADFEYTPEAHAETLLAFVRELGLQDVTLVLHDYGGPIGLPILLADPARVQRVVLLNTWAWSLADDPAMASRGRLVSGVLGRFLYGWPNASQRLLMPSVFADRARLTRAIHAQYLQVFPDGRSRQQVLWPFARAILGSTSFYEGLRTRLDELKRKPVLIVWGMKDTAFKPYMLQRWRELLPEAQVVELPVGHWPQEEAPNDVEEALRGFLTQRGGTGKEKLKSVVRVANDPHAAG